MSRDKHDKPGGRVWLARGVRMLFETSGQEEHFFGYYDKSPFDSSGDRLLCHSVDFRSDRLPTVHDRADIICWDLGRSIRAVLASTSAFNWQQGAMLQWLGPDFSSRVVFNDYRDGRYVAVVSDLDAGRERMLDNTVYSVTRDGRWAAGVNYERLFWCRPGYNYAWPGHERYRAPVSDDDGIHLVDTDSGRSCPIVWTRDVMKVMPLSGMETGPHYLEHILFSPGGERFMFLHRWRSPDGGIFTRVFVANRDGSDLRLLHDRGDVSHYAWKDEETLMVFGSVHGYLHSLRRWKWAVNLVLRPLRGGFKWVVRPGSPQEQFLLRPEYLFIDVTNGRITRVDSRQLRIDGHPSFHPVRRDVFVADTYPDSAGYRHLYLYNCANHEQHPIGRFFSPGWSNASYWAADLHPRWDRRGERVCIDSLHSERRQMMVLDVSELLEEMDSGGW